MRPFAATSTALAATENAGSESVVSGAGAPVTGETSAITQLPSATPNATDSVPRGTTPTGTQVEDKPTSVPSPGGANLLANPYFEGCHNCTNIASSLTLPAGKFWGSATTARFYRIPWRDSAVLGILMNTRGLLELIVLNIGLELKVISPALFAMLVIMSIVTTVITTPILDFLLPGASLARPPDELRDTGPIEILAPSGGLNG